MAAALAAAAVLTSGGGTAGADTPISQSAGRFLTGSAAGMSFDSIAKLDGVEASYPDNPSPAANPLSGSVLGLALASPLGNVSVPFPGGVTFGAVNQYAKANSDGSSVGASGAVSSNGAINVGGSGQSDTATIDLANLPGASTLTSIIGDLKLTIGAVSARAEQAAFGKKLADPSAGCTSGDYKRVSGADQAGTYQFANLKLAATSPLLAQLGTTITSTLGTVLSTLETAAKALPGGVVTIDNLPTAADLAKDLTLSLAGGGITLSLTDGSLTIDLAKILASVGVDINNLCPNTSLVPYLAKALAGLPAALTDLVNGLTTKLSDALNKVVIKVAGIQIPTATLTGLITTATGTLSSTLTPILTTVTGALQPVIDLISNDLLSLVVNVQDEADGKFTQTGAQLDLVPGGGSLPTLPVPTLPTPALTKASAAKQMAPELAKAQAQVKAQHAAKSSSKQTPASTSSTTTPKTTKTAKFTAFVAQAPAAKPLAAPLAAAAAGDPVLQLNLGSAAVTNNAPTPTSSTPTTSVPTTALPTGVPAGKGLAAKPDAGVPALPLVLALFALVVAGGGTLALRLRGKHLM